MKILLKLLQVIYSIYAILLFLSIMLVIFPFVVLATLLGKIKGGNIIYKLCSFWADAWFLLIGLYAPKIFESPLDKNKQYIFVANHISYMDVPMIVKVIRQPVRALGKYEMSKIPIFGFMYRNAAVMVDRSSPDNRAKSVKTLTSIIKKGISIFIFPEGTFNISGHTLGEFYDGAFKIAIETQTPILPIIFPDTLARLHYKSVFSFTPGKCRAVFLDPIAVDQYSLTDVPLLKEIVYKKMAAVLETID